MTYTLQLHNQRKLVIQNLLDELIILAKKHEWQPNSPWRLEIQISGQPVSEILEVSFSAPHGIEHPMRFFRLEIRGGSAFRLDQWLMNIQFNWDTGKVDDSAKFDGQRYLGRGHIQCWHDWQVDVNEKFNQLTELIQAARETSTLRV